MIFGWNPATSKFVDRERDQAFLLPPDLRDWIAEDDPAHFVIEPGFGIIEAVLGVTGFSLRGLDKVAGEWRLAAHAYNGKRLHKLKPAIASSRPSRHDNPPGTPGHTPATPEIRRGLDHRGRKPAFPPPPGLGHEKTPENLSSQNFGPQVRQTAKTTFRAILRRFYTAWVVGSH